MRAAFALVAWAAVAPSARGAEEAPGPEPKADAKPKPRPVNPKVVIVVECVRQSDVKAARDFIAFMTREPVPDMVVEERDGKARAVSSQQERFVASASLASARKDAEKEKALAIAHVKIIKREPVTRGGDPEMQASCSVLLPAAAKGSQRVSWKVKRAAILPPGQGAGIVLMGAGGLAPGDPPDFVEMRQEITRLVYDAAVGIAMPRMARPPKQGERVKVTVTNNSQLPIVILHVTMASRGVDCSWSYAGDPIPPGKASVELEAFSVNDFGGHVPVPDRPARMRYVGFAEAEAEQAPAPGAK